MEQPHKALRFGSESAADGNARPRYQATAKYDRKTLKRRLDIEEWMYYELKRLYDYMKEEETLAIEIDIDILLRQEDDEKRVVMLKVLLKEAKHPIKDFIRDLLQKIKQLDSVKQLSTEEQQF